jgi:hypothetical protein
LQPRPLGVQFDDHVIERLTATRAVDPVSDVPPPTYTSTPS